MAKKHRHKRILLFTIIVAIGVAVFLLVKPGSQPVDQVQADKNIGFTSNPMRFEDLAFQLTGTSHEDTKHVFHFTFENIDNAAVSTLGLSFKIKNNGNVYSSESV